MVKDTEDEVCGSCAITRTFYTCKLYTMRCDPDGFCEDCVKHTKLTSLTQNNFPTPRQIALVYKLCKVA